MKPSELIEKYAQGVRDFSGANLSEANLSEADLRGAYLRGADFSGTDLSRANLRGADSSEANLSEANLSEADLSKADLRGADLSKADLRGADLSKADLRWADLSKADLRGADLSKADLRGAYLHEAYLRGVKGLSTKGQELQILQFIKEEIVSQSLLDMSYWHTNWEWGDSLCGTTHCAAGSAQVWASLNGLTDYKDVQPWIAGSMLIPSVTHLFYSRNKEFVEYLDGILAGDIPLLDR